jgi:hypothetical protein
MIRDVGFFMRFGVGITSPLEIIGVASDLSLKSERRTGFVTDPVSS